MSMPELHDSISFISGSNCEIKMMIYDRENDEPDLMFARENKRWKWSGGRFVAKSYIASRMFKYDESPTQDQIDIMESYVDTLGSLLDASNELVIQKISENRIRREEWMESNKKANLKEFLNQTRQGPEKQDSYIYLMSHVSGLTKIGFSKNPKKREKTLQAEDPQLKLIFKMSGPMYREKQLHSVFSDRRVRGEWFDLDGRHIEWIKSLKGIA